jgi:hypothetical protein
MAFQIDLHSHEDVRNSEIVEGSGGRMKKHLAIFALVLFSASAYAQTLPAGTALRVRLDKTLTTFSSKPGDVFSGHVAQAIVIDGQTIVPAGAIVEGRVTKVSEPRRVSGKPTIGIRPDALVLPTGQRFDLAAMLVDTNLGRGTDVNDEGQFKGSGHNGRDALEIAGGTGGGMLIGGLAGGGGGLLIGGAIGGAAGTVHWLAQHRSAALPAGTELVIEVERPLALTTTTANAAQ